MTTAKRELKINKQGHMPRMRRKARHRAHRQEAEIDKRIGHMPNEATIDNAASSGGGAARPALVSMALGHLLSGCKWIAGCGSSCDAVGFLGRPVSKTFA